MAFFRIFTSFSKKKKKFVSFRYLFLGYIIKLILKKLIQVLYLLQFCSVLQRNSIAVISCCARVKKIIKGQENNTF